jgi:hypothetical protein
MMGLLLWHLITSKALGLRKFGQAYYGYEMYVYSTSFSFLNCLYCVMLLTWLAW